MARGSGCHTLHAIQRASQSIALNTEAVRRVDLHRHRVCTLHTVQTATSVR
jgi:hypothetical protein